jgi:hypothetical protein
MAVPNEPEKKKVRTGTLIGGYGGVMINRTVVVGLAGVSTWVIRQLTLVLRRHWTGDSIPRQDCAYERGQFQHRSQVREASQTLDLASESTLPKAGADPAFRLCAKHFRRT